MWDKLTTGVLGVLLWVPSGGLMMVHLAFSAIKSHWLLGAGGFFVPPIGLANGISWLFAGTDVISYFSN